jgi:hypothetical protein
VEKVRCSTNIRRTLIKSSIELRTVKKLVRFDSIRRIFVEFELFASSIGALKASESEGVASVEIGAKSGELASKSIKGISRELDFPKGSWAWRFGGILIVEFDLNMERS